VSLCVSLCLSVPLYVYLRPSMSFYVSPSLYVPLGLSMSLNVSQCLYFSLSLFLPILFLILPFSQICFYLFVSFNISLLLSLSLFSTLLWLAS
jgi:hypothetical protein